MKKGDKRKKKRALQKRTNRKQAGNERRAAGSKTVLRHVRRARDYPIEGCWVGEGWQEGGLAVVVVARHQPNGNIVFGGYMIDCYCLGLKDTHFDGDIPASRFRRDHLPQIFSEMSPLEISPALAHEIVYGGIAYAAQFGFRPHRDFRRSQRILDPPETHPRTGAVVFGKDGKPLYIQGPHDNVQAILRQLDRTVGAGNYHYLLQIGDPMGEEWDG